MNVDEKIREKAFRPMQKAGVYDPMEQAGHRDVVYVKDVLEILKTCVVIPVCELLEIYEDDRTYISKKDLIKKLLGDKK